MLAICSAASSAIARFSFAGMSKPPSSRRVAPSPMPKSTRPFEMRSSVAEHLGGARRVVVVGDHLADAVAEADPLGVRRRGGEEHLGRRRVRVLVEEVVLDLPRVVEAEPVGELDLLERLVEESMLVPGVPGLRQLELVENAKSHRSVLARVILDSREALQCATKGAGVQRTRVPLGELSVQLHSYRASQRSNPWRRSLGTEGGERLSSESTGRNASES